ncbi:MAG: hypothetical protein J6Y77_00910 [Paludibacteraceae bacterium]|nr:hypothetical protein [Paludibacteraceae bacterium]
MKKFILSALMVLAAAVSFTSCSNEEPEGTLTFTGKDSDDEIITLVINENEKTYEIFYAETKKDDTEMFSAGTYVLESNVSGDKTMTCTDEFGSFVITISADGKKATYSDGEEGGYSFELKKK